MTRKLTRRETVVELIKIWPEACGPGETGEGSDSQGSRSFQMSDLWRSARPTFLELERCMKKLREERRNQWWHLQERYLKCQRISQDLPVRSGRLIVPPHAELVGFGQIQGNAKTARAIIVRWNEAVRMQKVERAIDYICGEFSGEPFLPGELLDIVAA